MPTESQLYRLLQEIRIKESKLRIKTIAVTLLPVLLACGLLYYFAKKISASKEAVTTLQLKVDSLTATLGSYKARIDSIKDVYSGVSFNFDHDFGWAASDVVSKDSSKISESRKAHDEIMKYLKGRRVDTKTTIRYYAKKSDKGKIDGTLLKCGFRNIKTFTGSYNDKDSTNTINYSNDVPENNIKVIALSLIRAGIEVKMLAPYPASMQRRKHHSIEISGYKEFDKNPGIGLEDIKNLKR